MLTRLKTRILRVIFTGFTLSSFQESLASSFPQTTLIPENTMKKVILVDHPEMFEVAFAGESVFLPGTIHNRYYQNDQAYGGKYPSYIPAEDLLKGDPDSNWKFVIVADSILGSVMRAGNKENFGKTTTECGEGPQKKKKQKSLHHPTLSGGRSVYTAGVISWDDSLKKIVLDIDSGNYGLDISSLKSESRMKHLRFLKKFLEGYGLNPVFGTHDFEGQPDISCLILQES